MITGPSIKIVLVIVAFIVWTTLAGCREAQEAPDRLYTSSAAIGVVKEYLSTRTYEVRIAVAEATQESCENSGGLYHRDTCYVSDQRSCTLIDDPGAKWEALFVPADRRGNVTRYWEVEVERDAPFLGKDRLTWLVYEKSGRVVSQTEPAC